MESTLEDVVKRLEEQMTYENIDNEYPYFFPEISELYNYWIFRIKALQNKGARQILHNLNYYFSKKMYKEVVDFKIDENNKKNPKLLNKIGIAQKNLKNYSDTIKTYQKIWKSERNEKALFNLGLAYQEYAYHEPTEYSENIGKAEKYFQEVIKINKRYVDANVSLGILYYKAKNYTFASDYITKAIEQSDSDDWRILLAMGCILSDSNREYEKANYYFEMCEDLNPGSMAVNLNRAQNLILLGHYDEAKGLLNDIRTEKLKFGENEVIEDRSSRIILNILMISLHHLNPLKENVPDSYVEILKDLLTLLDLKDTDLVDWNFRNLEEVIYSRRDMDSYDKAFLENIFSIPNKSKNDIEQLKKEIQQYIVDKKLEYMNINFISNIDTQQVVKMVTKPIAKSNDNIQWYLWKISLELSRVFNDNIPVDNVVYTFDPKFQGQQGNSFYTKEGESNFPINVIGYEETKFEIEVKRKDDSILKMISKLKV
jgi:tetratricopeptide (TPR) repeat protein